MQQHNDSNLSLKQDENQKPTEQINSNKTDKGLRSEKIQEEWEKQPWEAQVRWIYAGHGEWTQIESEASAREHGNPL